VLPSGGGDLQRQHSPFMYSTVTPACSESVNGPSVHVVHPYGSSARHDYGHQHLYYQPSAHTGNLQHAHVDSLLLGRRRLPNKLGDDHPKVLALQEVLKGVLHETKFDHGSNMVLLKPLDIYERASRASPAVDDALLLELGGLDETRLLLGEPCTMFKEAKVLYGSRPTPSHGILQTREGCSGYLSLLTTGPRRTAQAAVKHSSMLEAFKGLRSLLFQQLANPTCNPNADRAKAEADMVRNVVVLSDVLLALHAALSHPPAGDSGGMQD
jgi:hypothetical protein